MIIIFVGATIGRPQKTRKIHNNNNKRVIFPEIKKHPNGGKNI